MTSPVVWLQSLLKDLPSSVEPMKAVLVSLHPSQLITVAQELDLDSVFSYLNSISSDGTTLEKQQKDVLELLQKLLDCLPPSTVLSRYVKGLLQGLNHPCEEIRETVLRQLDKCSTDSAALSSIAINQEMLHCIAKLIGDENMTIAKHSTTILTRVGIHPGTTTIIFGPPHRDTLLALLNKDEVVRFRIHEVFVNIACYSPAALMRVANSGFMMHFLDEVNGNDPLILLNSLELLIRLTSTYHGMDYLDQQGIVKKIEGLLDSAQHHPYGYLLLPGLLKFFGNVGHTYPRRILSSYPCVINTIFSCIQQADDPVLTGRAIETLGVIGSSPEGKKALQERSYQTVNCLKTLGNIIQTGQPELKSRTLIAIAHLLEVKDTNVSEDMWRITEFWYHLLHNQPTITILNLCKQPFPEVRYAAMSVIRAIASQDWGQKELALCPSFLEYILDRSTESEKEGKEAKYDIIQALIESRTLSAHFCMEAIIRLNSYYREGPFYVEAETSVAVEGAT